MSRKWILAGAVALGVLVYQGWGVVFGYGPAQNFTLLDLEKKPVTLSSLRGRPVVVCFYFLG